MNEHEINAAIAEACGKLRRVMSKEECKQARREWAKEEPTPYDELTYPQEFEGTIPDYYRDLNAMHEAEEWLMKNENISLYRDCLMLAVGLNPYYWRESQPFPSYEFMMVCTATARQRAEAFLRTIGKWREA